MQRALICSLIITLTWYQGFAQKVAVVLSGGGAKGLAHVGVLKALEENEVPIDYIVGTSMGGIVGGFYAAGYSPDQIEQIMLSDDFQRWVNGVLGDNYNFHYFKKENNASWLSVNLAVDSTLNTTLNTNLANDVALNFALAEYLAMPAERAKYNFDSLFIPFRAIAADIFTQNEVVLGSGQLSDALRATLSVPFFYRPIKIENKFLFDGGLYNNFPLNVAQEKFNPDVIIGVNVSSKKYELYPYDNDEKLIGESLLFMLMNKTDISLLDSNDIYIEPNLVRYSSMDFSYVKNIADSGYVETNRKMGEILEKISRRKSCEELAKDRESFVLGMKPLHFKKINLVGFKSKQRKYIRSLFNSNEETLSIYDVKSGYYKMVSEEYFKDTYPRMVYDSSLHAYRFDIYGRPRDYFNVEFGGNLATRSISQIFLGLNFSHFKRILFNHNLNFYTGRFYQSFQAKSRINVPTRFQFYLEPEFTFNNWDFINANEILLRDKDPVIIQSIDRRFGLNIGFPLGTKGKLVGTAAYINNRDRFSNDRILISTDILDALKIDGYRYGVSFSKNSLNRKQYPSLGSETRVAFDYFDLTEDYNPGNTSIIDSPVKQHHEWFRIDISSETYYRKGWYSYGYYLRAVASNQPVFTNYRATLINAPAFTPLNDSKTLFLPNFRAFSYGAVGLRNIFTLRHNLDLRLEGYLFKPIEEILRVEESQSPALQQELMNVYLAANSSLVYHSPIGPICLSVNYYDDEENKWGLLLHIGYTIFNRRSLE